MAYVSSTRAQAPSVFTGVVNAVKAASVGFFRRLAYVQTLRALQSLSYRDLNDLGISRADFAKIARDAAYGK